ncbi:MAG: hypothetical protein QOE70_3815 [Chthoniobacter sp.]|jgi:cyclophilin family peptidyl-prolyl cis-trans isomerase|nr:hypothetical protein [Chthoniobacter sp.]
MEILSSIARLIVVVSFTLSNVLAGEAKLDQPPTAVIQTSLGNLVLQLDWVKAPENCATFVRYIKEGVYAHTSFDDVDEMAFFGGKPSQPIPGVASNGNMDCTRGPVGEFHLPNKRGFVGFRRTVGDCNPEKRSNCTQIYVRFRDNPKADGQFTVFAAIEGDLKLVDTIQEKLLKKEVVPFSITVPVGA